MHPESEFLARFSRPLLVDVATLLYVKRLPPRSVMLRAFAAKDPAYDGVFYTGVKTTGVFCRPVCHAKPAKPANLEFFPSTADALYHGYRACKLCRPLDSQGSPPPIVQRLMSWIDKDPTRPIRERELIDAGIDASTARRAFKRYCGMTFAAYQRARRMGMALHQVRKGKPMIQTQLASGFESPSGFRQAFAKLFGTLPSDAQHVTTLISAWLSTPLGPMLAIADANGLALLDFVDRKGIETAIARLRERAGARGQPAVIVPGSNGILKSIEAELQAYFQGTLQRFTTPVSIRGTQFETQAWAYLSTIPYGQTRTYAQEARGLDNPAAVRAVGRANGMNYLSIIIPCHRVIASTGELAGYGGGVARKRWLLDHEAAVASQTASASTTRAPLFDRVDA